jgi:hypothetical protein
MLADGRVLQAGQKSSRCPWSDSARLGCVRSFWPRILRYTVIIYTFLHQHKYSRYCRLFLLASARTLRNLYGLPSPYFLSDLIVSSAVQLGLKKHTLTHLRPGPSGVTGLMGSLLGRKAELGLLRAHWIIGAPFVDLKSLATMSNAGGVGG